jgi:sulfur transfer protein SufE
MLHSKNVEMAYLTDELTTVVKKFDDLTASKSSWQALLDTAREVAEIAVNERDDAVHRKQQAELKVTPS